MNDLDEIDLFANPGHDRDCAAAMLSQSRLPHASRIDDIQVMHLLQIGYRAGRKVTGDDEVFDRHDRQLGVWQLVCLGAVAGVLLSAVLFWALGG